MSTRKMTLESGRTLEITAAPFAQAKALYQAITAEVKAVQVNLFDQDTNFMKDMLCTLHSSEKVEAALSPCLERCAYEGRRITADTFEPAEAREDFLEICAAVTAENIRPFTRALASQLRDFGAGMSELLRSGSRTPTSSSTSVSSTPASVA